ncbi:hypothetical protein B4N89_38550 [Embleya scabrispora]|uniref:Lipoprotein n=2 Tax=Embleya scabrispora TaxID=159449 RepID=A0A1T3NMR0_9ACTN|nr:hypothetical protein B4N89_38550 [Embleya scabrispora]
MVLVTGCSAAADLADTASADLSKLSTEAVSERVARAVDRVHSVRATVELRRNGTTQRTDLRLDIRTGDYSATAKTSSYTIETVRIGEDVYVKAPRAYWQSRLGRDKAALLNSLDGKYGHVAADDPARSTMKNLSKKADPHTILPNLGDAERRPDSTVDGRRVVVLAESGEKNPDLLYIPVEGPALPVKVAGSDSATLTWSEYDHPVDIQAPAPDRIVELPNLGTARPGAGVL